ncbi:hypothetical protein BaRGS_00000549, partial [Batillaria attramentaria]
RSGVLQLEKTMPRGEVLLALVCVVCLPATSQSYSTGASPAACSSLSPAAGHGGLLQTSPSPYGISVSSATYTPGGPAIRVTLESRCRLRTFRGFLLTARHAETSRDQSVQLGSFDTPAYTHDECSGVQGGTPVAENKLVSPNVISLGPGCMLPATAAGTNPPPAATVAATVALTTSSARTVYAEYADCGRTKSCFSDCSADHCEFLMTWAPVGVDGDSVAVTLKAPIDPYDYYVAFGLSTDQHMGNDSVTECTHSRHSVAIYNSWNTEHRSNRRLDQSGQHGLLLTSAHYADGILTCSFTRTNTGPTSEVYNLDDSRYYILLSRGAAYS